MNNTIEITDANFKEKVKDSSMPVLVDFWAPWCGPCRLISPLVEELALEYDGKLLVGKLNTDDNQGVASEYSIRAIPTLLFFKDGEVVDQVIGGQLTKDALKQRVDTIINN